MQSDRWHCVQPFVCSVNSGPHKEKDTVPKPPSKNDTAHTEPHQKELKTVARLQLDLGLGQRGAHELALLLMRNETPKAVAENVTLLSSKELTMQFDEDQRGCYIKYVGGRRFFEKQLINPAGGDGGEKTPKYVTVQVGLRSKSGFKKAMHQKYFVLGMAQANSASLLTIESNHDLRARIEGDSPNTVLIHLKDAAVHKIQWVQGAQLSCYKKGHRMRTEWSLQRNDFVKGRMLWEAQRRGKKAYNKSRGYGFGDFYLRLGIYQWELIGKPLICRAVCAECSRNQ